MIPLCSGDTSYIRKLDFALNTVTTVAPIPTPAYVLTILYDPKRNALWIGVSNQLPGVQCWFVCLLPKLDAALLYF